MIRVRTSTTQLNFLTTEEKQSSTPLVWNVVGANEHTLKIVLQYMAHFLTFLVHLTFTLPIITTQSIEVDRGARFAPTNNIIDFPLVTQDIDATIEGENLGADLHPLAHRAAT
jgi:hypothetical protein